MSGQAVRLNKRYGVIGVLAAMLGIVAVLFGVNDSVSLIVAGCVLVAVGIFLATYYLSFGVYYDEDTFLLATLGKKSAVYAYSQIKSQQLYNSYGNIIIELHMDDGRAVQLQASMSDVYPFLDKAFGAWLRQKGLRQEDCSFYDPDNSCWFPPMEG